MATAEVGKHVLLKNILYLTDFSEPSEAALPFAMAISRSYGAMIHVLHVEMPMPYVYSTPETAAAAIVREEESAEAEMQRVESQLLGLPHDTTVERGTRVWPIVEQAIRDDAIDLLVLGTHGRTGAQKLLMGSVAEEILRRSPVPVMTIGPLVRRGLHIDARFHRVLYPSDFTPEAIAAAPYAVSFAQENQARLTLLHVIPRAEDEAEAKPGEISVADALHNLGEMLPPGAELWCRPDPLVEYGHPATRILEVTNERGVDLIVMGVRQATGRVALTTHLNRGTAYRIVASAVCPVLTVRG